MPGAAGDMLRFHQRRMGGENRMAKRTWLLLISGQTFKKRVVKMNPPAFVFRYQARQNI